MAPRPTWKGYLRLSLVACPVRLYPATTRRERVSFHLLNPETHNRIELRPHDPETGAEVPRERLVRGYEFDKGRYVVVDEAELEALRVESSETIDLFRFVDDKEIDPIYFATPYFVAPEGKIADETFHVIHEAMKEAGKAGLGRIVLSTREHPALLTPRHRGMLLITLRPAEEVRSDDEYFGDIQGGKIDREMVELAMRIIAQKSGPFDGRELTGDRYQQALRDLVARKVRGEKPVVPKLAQPRGNVINLMDALKRSLDEERKPPAPSRKRPHRASSAGRTSTARRRRS
jgi:DNA end-binding protein Ku